MLKTLEKITKIVIHVEGGCVQSVMSNDANVRVVLVDQDNFHEEDDPEAAEKEALEDTEDCIHEVF